MITNFVTWLFKPISCKFGDHKLVLNTSDPATLKLVCINCPYESPGWSIKTGNRPRQTKMARFR